MIERMLLWLCLSFRNVANCGFIWLRWSPTGKKMPGCCFWREAVITCGLLSHLIKEEKLILESRDWNTHQKGCKACTHTHTHFNTHTHTLCPTEACTTHTGVHTHTQIHQHKSLEAGSLIELSHRSTNCFFPAHTLFFSILLISRVEGGKKRDREAKKEAKKEKQSRERKEAEVKIQRERERWMAEEVLDG